MEDLDRKVNNLIQILKKEKLLPPAIVKLLDNDTNPTVRYEILIQYDMYSTTGHADIYQLAKTRADDNRDIPDVDSLITRVVSRRP